MANMSKAPRQLGADGGVHPTILREKHLLEILRNMQGELKGFKPGTANYGICLERRPCR